MWGCISRGSRGTRAGARSLLIVADAVAVVVVLDRGLDGLLCQDGNSGSSGWAVIQGASTTAWLVSFTASVNGLSLHQLPWPMGLGNGGPAAEGVELHIGNDPVLHLDLSSS